MSCSNQPLVIRVGETVRMELEQRDLESDELVALLPKARANIRVAATGAPLLSLSSGAGEIVVDDDAGTAVLTITSVQSASLSPSNERVEAIFAIEFYDDLASPEEVDAYPEVPCTIVPDYVHA